MGKSIISQARGKGGLTYRVRRRAYRYRIGYPATNSEGRGKILVLLNSPGHSAPLAKIIINNQKFYNPAAQGVYEGQDIELGGINMNIGNISQLKNIQTGISVFNIEKRPGDGGKILRSSGTGAIVVKKENARVFISFSKKKEVSFDENCRATIGTIAGQGRKIKPIVKAGKKHMMVKARNKLWPRTSAIKVNAVDHPFGSGRGKRVKSKIAKKNAPPGAKV